MSGFVGNVNPAIAAAIARAQPSAGGSMMGAAQAAPGATLNPGMAMGHPLGMPSMPAATNIPTGTSGPGMAESSFGAPPGGNSYGGAARGLEYKQTGNTNSAPQMMPSNPAFYGR